MAGTAFRVLEIPPGFASHIACESPQPLPKQFWIK